MTTHRLKTTPEYFAAVWSGEKPYEIRWDDRAYQPGHTVVLQEFDPSAECKCLGPDHRHRPACEKYTGRWIEATVGHVAASTPPRGRQPGFRGDGYVVFALLDIETSDDMPVDEPTSAPTDGRSLGRQLADVVASITHPSLPRSGVVAAPTPLDLASRRSPCSVVPATPRLAYTSESGGA